MRTFRFLPPSPGETRAFFVFAFGAFVGQLAAFLFLLMAPTTLAGAIAIGGGLAILARFFHATWQFDARRRRAQNAAIEMQTDGLRLFDERGRAKFVRWNEIESVESRGGRFELTFRGEKYSFGTREVENAMLLVGEITRRVGKKSNVIALEAK